MRRRRFEEFESDEHVFRFLYDKDEPDLLHMEASHGLTVDDAIDTFLDGQNSTMERTTSEQKMALRRLEHCIRTSEFGGSGLIERKSIF